MIFMCLRDNELLLFIDLLASLAALLYTAPLNLKRKSESDQATVTNLFTKYNNIHLLFNHFENLQVLL